MVDASLRELERRFRVTGRIEDEVAWLLARVRAGSLEPSRLELAAYCGHAASLVVRPGAAQGGPAFDPWSRGLERWGREPCVRAACVAARHALVKACAPPSELLESTAAALRAADDWLACPCAAHEAAAWTLWRTPVYGPDDVFKLSDRVAKVVGVTAKDDWLGNECWNALSEAAMWSAGDFTTFHDPRLRAAEDDVRSVVSLELVRWALVERPPPSRAPSPPSYDR